MLQKILLLSPPPLVMILNIMKDSAIQIFIRGISGQQYLYLLPMENTEPLVLVKGPLLLGLQL